MPAFWIPSVEAYRNARSVKGGSSTRLLVEIGFALNPYGTERVPRVSLEGYTKEVIGGVWDLFRRSELGWDVDYIEEGHPLGPAFEFFWNEFCAGDTVDWVDGIGDLKHPFLPSTDWDPAFWCQQIGPGPFAVYRVEREGDRVVSRHAQRITLAKPGTMVIWAHGRWMKDNGWPIPDLVAGAWFQKVTAG